MLDKSLSDELKELLNSSVGGDKAIDEIYVILFRILDELRTIKSMVNVLKSDLSVGVSETTTIPVNAGVDTALIAEKIVAEIIASDLSLSAPALKINYDELASIIAKEQLSLFEQTYNVKKTSNLENIDNTTKKTVVDKKCIASSGGVFNLLINKIKGVFFGSFK